MGRKESNQSNKQMPQDINGKVTNSQLDITSESQEVSPFPAGDHKALIKRRPGKYNKNQDRNNINDQQKSTALERSAAT